MLFRHFIAYFLDVRIMKQNTFKIFNYPYLMFLRGTFILLFYSILFFFHIIPLSFQIAYCETIGQIKPRVVSNSFNTYVWDGKVIKPRNGSTCKTTWGFDGNELRKNCGSTSSNTYLWNGKKVRPMTGATGRTTWIWNGTELKRQVGSTSGNTWSFDGHYWSLKQGANGKNSWVVSGFIPIPVCVLIILGLNAGN